MNHRFRIRPIWMLLAALSLVSIPSLAGDTSLPNMLRFPNPTGFAATFSTTGKVDLTGPFFQSLGTNGRSCGSCHQPSDGWTVTPDVPTKFRRPPSDDGQGTSRSLPWSSSVENAGPK